MNSFGLNLPMRQIKPRQHGITVLIDNGVPLQFFKDTIGSAVNFIDFVKFGWGTSIVTNHLLEKIKCLEENQIEFFFGGTLFEKFLSQRKLEEFYQYCLKYNCRYMEISNGTLDISNKEKAFYISEFSKEFIVFSEVGSKNSSISDTHHSNQWIEYMLEDLEAGATKVITEARESGTSGICSSKGEIRCSLIENILSSRLNINDIIFEAPTKPMQTYFIKMIGSNVNLANISFNDPIPLETLRLGLRSDTFHLVSQDEEEFV